MYDFPRCFLICYNYSRSNGSFGFGNWYVKTSEKIDNTFIYDMQKKIEEALNGEHPFGFSNNVVIINISQIDDIDERFLTTNK